ncbi:hypothetical protein N9L90_01105 [Planctomycetota bacterium]|nr:hypothetical protein [Planctomycetota bacterium]
MTAFLVIFWWPLFPLKSRAKVSARGAKEALEGPGLQAELAAQVDLAAIPQPTGPAAAQPGETWHFQALHRTTLAGLPTSNFTDAVRVTLQ